jgi:hypothetical protein
MATTTISELPASTLTTNTSYLQPTGFKLVMDRRNFPNLEYFAQSVVHPSASTPTVDIPTARLTNAAFSGDKIDYSELSCTIIMDEEMKGYEEMLNWMERIVQTPARTARQVLNNDGSSHEADITLSVLSSANNVTRQIRYANAVPVSISEVMFESTVGDIQYITFSVTFRFDYFTLV